MTKTVKGKIVSIIVLCSIMLSISLVYAYFEDSVSVKNHISVGDINIGLKEYEIKNGREVLYENPKLINPGDVISKIPRIVNYANECWIRANISYGNDQQELDGLSMKNILGMTEDWILRGEYYYYTKPLAQNEQVDLFQQVLIPEEWNEKHSSQKLSIRIQAEAIQAANFKPDFTAMSPWGNQEIELCIHEENGVSACVKEEMDLVVEFSGKANKLLAVPDNFFHNIKRAMPGDSFQDEIQLLNTTDMDAELFFRTELESMSKEQLELLEKIYLSISIGEQVLYEGNLCSKELEKNVSLGNFPKGAEAVMTFQLRVPAELNNAYALREANVKWIFTVEGDEEKNGNSNDSADAFDKSAVKTGDESPIIMLSVILIVSAGILITCIFKRKKGARRHEK